MKLTKQLLAATMAALSLSATAALPQWESAQRLDLPKESFHPVLSPDGSLMLFSTMDHTGLQCLDMASGQIQIIDNKAAAGFNPIFSNDGNKIYYQTSQYVDGLISRDTRCHDLRSNVRRQISEMSRDAIDLRGIDNTNYAVSNFKSIKVNIDGKQSSIAPLGADAYTYEWATLSPAGDKVLFSDPFVGIFICAVDGSNPVKVAPQATFPCWLDNNIIAYVIEHNDGYFITEAYIEIADITTGETARLTGDETLVGEMSAAANNGAIAFSTHDGEIFILNPKR